MGLQLAASFSLVSSLEAIPLSDGLVWLAILGFLLAVVLQWRGRLEAARTVAVAAWVLFGIFWLSMVPYFYADAQSPLETILSLAALPLCVYCGYLLQQGRDSLLLLTRAVALMGVIYLPAETIPVVREWLIETTAAQTHFGMELLGHSPGINESPDGYLSRFDFDPDATVTGRTTYIVMACTGIGSISIFGGLVAAVSAPLSRKIAAFSVAVGIIWILNLARNVFVGLASPWGWFQQDVFVHITTTYMGAPASKTSYLIAHNFIAQSLSIVALIGITYVVLRIVPEVLDVLEEVLFVMTGTEYDLADALGEPELRADGGE